MSPLGTALLLATGSLLCTAVRANSQGDASTAGYLFTAQQSLTSVTISAAAINPSGSTSYVDVIFPNTQLPSQGCGDRYARCDVTLVSLESTNSSEVVVLVAIGSGAAVALFDKSQSNLILLENYTLSLPGTPNSCSLTSFIQDQTSLYGLCYQFTSDEGQVMLDVYRTIKSTDRFFFSPHIAVTDQFFVSKAFLSSCSSFPKIYWFGNAFLYNLRVDIQPSFLEHQDLEDFPECFGNGTRQLALFQDNSLLAYCGSSSTVEIDLCGIEDPIRTPSRFYCSESRQRYLSIENGFLSVNSSVDYVIPFPLDTNMAYVGDCVEIGERVYFIGSSVSGAITLINVLDNSTTILTMDAPVNHQVIENRFILYTNSTSSSLLDLSCRDPTILIHVNHGPFNLATFSLNTEFSCSTVQPTTMATTVAMETTNEAASLSSGAIAGIIVGVLIFCALFSVAAVVVGILCRNVCTNKHYRVTCDPVSENRGELTNLSPKNHLDDIKSVEKKPTTPLTVVSSAALNQTLSPPADIHDGAASGDAQMATQDELLKLAENTPTIPIGVPEQDSEFNHSGCLPNETAGTPIPPIHTELDSQTSIGNLNTVNTTTVDHSSVGLINPETVRPNNENDDKNELVTNGFPSVPTMNTGEAQTRVNPHAQAQPIGTNPLGANPLTQTIEAVPVSHTVQDSHMTEPGLGLPHAHDAFHPDQLKWNHSQQQSVEPPTQRTVENTLGAVNSEETDEPDNER